jgi:hypothetical protein
VSRKRDARRRRTRRREGGQSKSRGRYWLTPKVWKERCSHCGASGSIACRPVDRKFACASCIETLGINARESKAWRDGGAKAGAAVTIRHVDPESLRRPPMPAAE